MHTYYRTHIRLSYPQDNDLIQLKLNGYSIGAKAKDLLECYFHGNAIPIEPVDIRNLTIFPIDSQSGKSTIRITLRIYDPLVFDSLQRMIPNSCGSIAKLLLRKHYDCLDPALFMPNPAAPHLKLSDHRIGGHSLWFRENVMKKENDVSITNTTNKEALEIAVETKADEEYDELNLDNSIFESPAKSEEALTDDDLFAGIECFFA